MMENDDLQEDCAALPGLALEFSDSTRVAGT
jgi:hypothetical protein